MRSEMRPAKGASSPAGTAGSFCGALLGGLLYGAGGGMPFLAAGGLFALAMATVLTPAVARLFPTPRGRQAPTRHVMEPAMQEDDRVRTLAPPF